MKKFIAETSWDLRGKKISSTISVPLTNDNSARWCQAIRDVCNEVDWGVKHFPGFRYKMDVVDA